MSGIRLEEDEARRRLARCSGPVARALEFERRMGGRVLAGVSLGLDTHRTHPPHDAYDRWLSRDLELRLVQIGFGGSQSATFWLDDRDWVHAIAPLDRLRPVADSLDAFVSALSGGRVPRAHPFVIALSPLGAEDSAAVLGVGVRCPVGQGAAILPDDGLATLEEAEYLAEAFRAPFVVVSAPALELLAEGFAALLALAPDLSLVFLDALPSRAEAPLVDVRARASYRVPYDDRAHALAVGLDANGRAVIVQDERD